MYSEHSPKRVSLAFFLCLTTWLVGQEVPKTAPTARQTRFLRLHPCFSSAGAKYKKWLAADVLSIVTDQERSNFMKLCDDGQRDYFIEEFWARRDPTPGTAENEFKEEHYRRFAYSNVHFAGAVPGWKTDRGRIYILYGPPDKIESHSAGWRGADASSDPYEVWHYRLMDGIGYDVDIEFVDSCKCGNYHFVGDPPMKPTLRLPWLRYCY